MPHSVWKISEAKAHLPEVVLYDQGKPVAAIIGIERFEAFQRFLSKLDRPSMTALLAELDNINREEEGFGDPPPRTNREFISTHLPHLNPFSAKDTG